MPNWNDLLNEIRADGAESAHDRVRRKHKPPSLSDPPVPNVCPYDIVGPCFKSSASYGGTLQLSRLLAGALF